MLPQSGCDMRLQGGSHLKPSERLYRSLVLMSRHDNMPALTARESTRYIQGDGRGSSAGVPEHDQIVLVARHEQVHRWVPLDIESSLTGESFVVRRDAVHVRLLDVQTTQ